MSKATPNQPSQEATPEITAEQVGDYLAKHPEFFDQQRELLHRLAIPHLGSSQAASLIERQVASLRTENTELTQRLSRLLANARTNDQLFNKTKRLLLRLIASDSLIQIRDRLEKLMQSEFGSSTCRLWFSDEIPAVPANASMPMTQTIAGIARFVTAEQPLCGILRAEENELLFGEAAERAGSAAVVPLRVEERLIGLLAIASEARDYYRDNIDTSVLTFIGDLTAAIIHRVSQR